MAVVYCDVLQHVAVCCSVLQCIAADRALECRNEIGFDAHAVTRLQCTADGLLLLMHTHKDTQTAVYASDGEVQARKAAACFKLTC